MMLQNYCTRYVVQDDAAELLYEIGGTICCFIIIVRDLWYNMLLQNYCTRYIVQDDASELL